MTQNSFFNTPVATSDMHHAQDSSSSTLTIKDLQDNPLEKQEDSSGEHKLEQVDSLEGQNLLFDQALQLDYLKDQRLFIVVFVYSNIPVSVWHTTIKNAYKYNPDVPILVLMKDQNVPLFVQSNVHYIFPDTLTSPLLQTQMHQLSSVYKHRNLQYTSEEVLYYLHCWIILKHIVVENNYPWVYMNNATTLLWGSVKAVMQTHFKDFVKVDWMFSFSNFFNACYLSAPILQEFVRYILYFYENQLFNEQVYLKSPYVNHLDEIALAHFFLNDSNGPFRGGSLPQLIHQAVLPSPFYHGPYRNAIKSMKVSLPWVHHNAYTLLFLHYKKKYALVPLVQIKRKVSQFFVIDTVTSKKKQIWSLFVPSFMDFYCLKFSFSFSLLPSYWIKLKNLFHSS